MENIKFIGDMRKDIRVSVFRINHVLQGDNIYELSGLLDFSKEKIMLI